MFNSDNYYKLIAQMVYKEIDLLTCMMSDKEKEALRLYFKRVNKIQSELDYSIPWYWSAAIHTASNKDFEGKGKFDHEYFVKELQTREKRNIDFWDRWKKGEITPENFFQESSWVSITHSNNKK